jgi:hypothetical protein
VKKLLLLLALIAIYTSCKKKDCWTCTAEETGGAATILPGSKSVTDSTVCDKSEEEIRKYEQEMTGTFPYEENGQTYTLTRKVTCD